MRKMLLPLLTCLLIATAGVSQNQRTIEKVSPDVATVLLQSHPDMVIIDLRSQDQVLDGEIEGARHLSVENGDFVKTYESLDRKTAYLLIGSETPAGQRAFSMMKDAGFEEVYWLEGGYEGWLLR